MLRFFFLRKCGFGIKNGSHNWKIDYKGKGLLVKGKGILKIDGRF